MVGRLLLWWCVDGGAGGGAGGGGEAHVGSWVLGQMGMGGLVVGHI